MSDTNQSDCVEVTYNDDKYCIQRGGTVGVRNLLMLAKSSQGAENIWIMAYDHGGDLPDNYDFLAMVSRLASPERRALLHAVAERDSFLNELGHVSVTNGLSRVYSAGDVQLADLGATLYEGATSIQFVGGDEVGTPHYHDLEGARVAMLTALEIDHYDGFGVLSLADTAVAVLEEEAEQLVDLVRVVSTDILDGTDPSTVRRVLTGAALMRVLNITAQMRLYGEDPNWAA